MGLGICLVSFAQNDSYILKATHLFDPDMRLLYIGINNPITIENINDTNVFLGITQGTCTKAGRGNSLQYYSVWVTSATNKTTIRILKKTQTDTALIDTVNYTVLRIPDPKPLFGNLIDTVATVNALILQKEIKIFMPCYYELGFRVISFTLSVIRDDSLIQSIETCGNTITEKQKKLIKNLKPGDDLLIEDIKCCGGSCTTRTLYPIRIKVKKR